MMARKYFEIPLFQRRIAKIAAPIKWLALDPDSLTVPLLVIN
jgi:hypothetical protein